MHGDWTDYRIAQLRRDQALRDAEAFRLAQNKDQGSRSKGRALRLVRTLAGMAMTAR